MELKFVLRRIKLAILGLAETFLLEEEVCVARFE